jgi:hypothetical protein
MDQLTGDSRREDGEGEAYSGRDEGQRGAGRHGRAERGAGDLEGDLGEWWWRTGGRGRSFRRPGRPDGKGRGDTVVWALLRGRVIWAV